MPPSPRPTRETLLFWALLALHLLPIWIFPFIPTQDGPGHQAVAFILRQYDHPAAGLLRQYYLPNQEALPNWFIFFLMGRVLGFVSVPVAEKILLTAYVLLLPLAARYALRAIDPRAGFLAVLAFPFLYNFMFNMGFFNFCFSLAAFFFAVGYWLKHAERMGPGRTAVLALLVLWVYFCHPVTLVVTVAALLTLAGWRMLLDLLAAPERRFAPAALWRGFRRWLLAPALACLPPLILIASFVLSRSGSRIEMLPMWVKIKHLAGLYSLVSLSTWTIPLAIALAFLFYAMAALCLRARWGRPLQAGDGLLLAVAVLAVAFFAAPSQLSGGGFVNHRLLLFPFLTLDPLVRHLRAPRPPAARHPDRGGGDRPRLPRPVRLGVPPDRPPPLRDRGRGRLHRAGPHLPLPLLRAPGGGRKGGEATFRTWPFVHAGGYIAARKRLVDLSLYEANENYFPLYYRPALNPFLHLTPGPLGIESRPPEVDLLGYPRRTGGSVDYVLLWGLRDELRADPKVRAVQDQLAAAYDLIHRTRDGRVLLYKRRPAI